MKIRNGFISNSSSSSFIITYKEEVCDKCGHKSPDFNRFINNDYDSRTEVLGETKEDIIKRVTNWYGDSAKKEILEKVSKADSNMKFIMLEISKWNQEFIDYLIEDKNIEIIYRDVEY